jgi:hypothetical protein
MHPARDTKNYKITNWLLILSAVYVSCADLQAAYIGVANTAGSESNVVNIRSYGASGTGAAIDGPAIARALTANPTGQIYFPAGAYLLDNRGARHFGVTIGPSFHGTLRFAAGARLVCNTADRTAAQCVRFAGAKDIHVEGMTVGYRDKSQLPLIRTALSPDNAIIVEEGSSDISFLNTTVEASPGSGIWITDSVRIHYKNTAITNTSADGIHFENCLDCGTDGTSTDNTGDDAIAFTNVAKVNPSCGGYAYNSRITNSRADGISVAGACGITVRGFEVQRTAYNCVGSDRYGNSPHNIAFSNGTCRDNGNGKVLPAAGTTGNLDAITISNSTAVTLDGILIDSPGNDGVFIENSSTSISLLSVTVRSARNVGFQTTSVSGITMKDVVASASNSHDFSLQLCANCQFSDIKSDHAGADGVYTSGLADAKFSNVKITDARGGDAHLAWITEHDLGPVEVNGLTVIDDQAKPTGYVVGDYNNGSHPNVVYNIKASIPNGKLVIGANNGGTAGRYLFVGQGSPLRETPSVP